MVPLDKTLHHKAFTSYFCLICKENVKRAYHEMLKVRTHMCVCVLGRVALGRVALGRVFCVPAQAMANCIGQRTASVELALSCFCLRTGEPTRLSGLSRECFADQAFFLAPASPFLSSMYLFNEVFILKYPAFTRFAQSAFF